MKSSVSRFFIGLIMMAAGLYWFLTSVSVSSVGFYSFYLGNRSVGGLVVVPFIIGIAWVFAKPESMLGRIIMVLGLIIIIASVIAGTHLVFNTRTLFEYLIMLILMVGGFALVMSELLRDNKSNKE